MRTNFVDSQGPLNPLLMKYVNIYFVVMQETGRLEHPNPSTKSYEQRCLSCCRYHGPISLSTKET